MSVAPLGQNLTFANAKALANREYLVFPCKPFSKAPATKTGFHDASCDPAQIAAWFDNDKSYNLAIATGPQPNGINLLAIDVDPKNGGDVTWTSLTDRHGVPMAPRHDTPHRGFHLFLALPPGAEVSIGQNTLGKGVDIRCAGGYVVVPPSQLTDEDTGEIIRYSTTKTLALAVNDPPLAPAWIVEALTAPRIEDAIARHPSQPSGGDTPADWVRANLDWAHYLAKHGWHHVRGELWRHPDATNDHSASLKNDGMGPLNGYSTNFPPVLMALDRNRTGSVSTFALFDFIAAYEFGGDTSACARWVRSLMPSSASPRVRAAPGGDSAGDGQVPPAVGTTVTRLPVVDPAYWSSCERNALIQQAARARMVAPDALDAVVYALQACLVPPSVMIESLVGGPQPINMLSCLVARTGDFKTSTMSAALDLIGALPPWVMTIGMGSGEGIGAMFLEDEYETNAKTGKLVKTGRLKRNDLRAVLFEADEGSGLTATADRNGATIIANLCKAWSGSTLGESNADVTRRRRVLHNDYRIGAVVNMQPTNFAGLFSEANTGTGLTGRFLFTGTLDPDIPDAEPPWPGELEFPILPQTPIVITLDETIKAEAKARIRERHRTSSLEGAADHLGQAPATQARMAAILAISDDRRHITSTDWYTASLRAQASEGCLLTLSQWSAAVESDRHHSADAARAASRDRQEQAYDHRKTGQCVDRVLTVLAAGPMSGGNISAKLTNSLRPYRDDALELLVAMGKVALDGDQWRCL